MGPGQRTDAEVMALFESWIVKHGKAYNVPGEKERRFEIFKDTLRFIDKHNSENHLYTVGLNFFSDLTNEEFNSTYVGRLSEEPPESPNCKEEGTVVGVKDQGSSDAQQSEACLDSCSGGGGNALPPNEIKKPSQVTNESK